MADQNENVDEEEILIPGYACDERIKDGYVEVTVLVKGLKVSSDIVFKSMLPKRVKKPENAKVDMVFGNRSLCLTVVGEGGDLKWKKYQLNIEQLPHAITPEKSYYEVGKNKVVMYLCKTEDRSWCPQIETGLETADIDDCS